MPSAILGKKLGMTQIFEEGGRVTPVTVIAAGPCVVTQLKTLDRDGYAAAQIGFESLKAERLPKARRGPHRIEEVLP